MIDIKKNNTIVDILNEISKGIKKDITLIFPF
jgi:hypothetical protein